MKHRHRFRISPVDLLVVHGLHRFMLVLGVVPISLEGISYLSDDVIRSTIVLWMMHSCYIFDTFSIVESHQTLNFLKTIQHYRNCGAESCLYVLVAFKPLFEFSRGWSIFSGEGLCGSPLILKDGMSYSVSSRPVDEIDRWMNEWMDGWMDG